MTLLSTHNILGGTKSSQRNPFLIIFICELSVTIHFQELKGSLNSVEKDCFIGNIIAIKDIIVVKFFIIDQDTCFLVFSLA